MLTEKEMQTLEALVKHRKINVAAKELKVKSNTVSQRISRMQLKEKRYEVWLQQYRRYKIQMPLKYVE